MSTNPTPTPQTRLIDSLPVHPHPKEMQILILGMPRTGVSSLRAALNKLSYTTFHGSMMNQKPHLYPYWTEAIILHDNLSSSPNPPPAYTRQDYDKILGDYDVSCNLPGTFVWRDLVDAYPNAKIILTCRDVDKWCKSMKESVDQGVKWWSWDFVAPFHPVQGAWWKYQKFQQRLRKRIAPQGERQAYIDHYADIREYVDEERLLEFDVKGGWAPLCEFLGKEVPEEAFPHVNDRDGFMVARTQRWWKAWHAMCYVCFNIVINIA
ncbi:P-loop containing nucleoside triphosphate hydrolase protein [Lophiotrema nucula]|uniref:P-loop containing nucleoside triphosphate hydrolase protein n=1 Tax=Lophiotrema nucula TaxID=690887 RepID=A0A6A5Z3J6_9PLEO|nr:P-loop containing nucleoside triphosphate hydrolase protein [Lophiotrema nucula]